MIYKIFIATMYFVIQNSYFGWNPLPESDVELITDLMFLILVAILFNKDVK